MLADPEEDGDIMKKAQELLAELYEYAKNNRSVSDYEIIIPKNYTGDFKFEVIITPLGDVNLKDEDTDEDTNE